MDERSERLLSYLSINHFVTSTFLATQLNISEKTARNRIKELEVILQNHGATIISKQRMGYILDIKDPNLFYQFYSYDNKIKKHIIPVNSRERIQYIINYLLWNKESVKMDDLAEELCVSKSTLALDMKKVEEIFLEYHIDIIRKPYYGMNIQASEMDVRFCIVNQLAKKEGYFNLGDDEIQNQYIIGKIVKDVLFDNELYISELLLQNIITHLDIALKRIEKQCVMPYSLATHQWIVEKMGDALSATIEISKQIEQQLGIQIPPQEIDYIAIHLVGKRIVGTTGNEQLNVVISADI